MSSRALATTLIALYAGFLVLTSALNLAAFVSYLILEPQLYGGREGNLMAFGPLVTSLLAGVGIFLLRDRIGMFVASDSGESADPITTRSALSVGLCLIGVYLLVIAIPAVITQALRLPAAPADEMTRANLAGAIVQAIFGACLVFGTPGLRSAWRSVRPLADESGSADPDA